MIAVPTEASAFLGAVGAFLVILVIFYLYLSKKLCFTSIGGFPCCDKPLVEHKEPVTKDLGTAFQYEEVESSTDSEDEVLQRFQQSSSLYTGLRKVGGENSDQIGGNVTENQDNHRSPYASGPPGCNASSAYLKVAENNKRGSHDPISMLEKGRVSQLGSPSSSSEASESEDIQDDGQAVIQPLLDSRTTQHYENSAFQTADDSPAASNDTYSACGDSVMEDQIYDVNELHCNVEDHDTSSAVRCGSLEVGFAYDAPLRKMTVHVLQAQDLPDRDRGGSNHVQVRLLLLPHKRQKFKTKIRTGSKPQFNESFIFNRISPEELNSMGVRFRLNGCERMRREHLIGECMVPFSSIRMDQQITLWLTLEPRANIAHSDSKADITSLARSDSTGSTQSMQHGGLPELLLGLAYNGTTGRLSVEINKGSHFRNVSMNRAPDTYVKLSLVSSNGQEIARSKTSVRRGQPNPLFKETFIFQVALFQLPDVTLMISVYNKRSMKRKEMIGWFSLGLNSSGDEELAHWNDMRENRGEQVCRWHVLLET
ncbi:synaptotagmin-14-like isoform X2 [Stegodyphus dumicola]|uniref:synaptotagmin-14-like isoform X2 n=1 Tax=Stegodyphus dumicola TaxID=202533 RepID=UPI0015A9293C|nr:synaptotagmin-14-like isoform X2 [Stegodyphus dumicola]